MKKIILIPILVLVFQTAVFSQFSKDKKYYIINEHTDMYLAVSKDSLKSGQFIVQTHKDSLNSIKWNFVGNRDGSYYLQNDFTKKYALIYKGTMKPGAVMMQSSKPQNKAFVWKVNREKTDSERFKIRNGNSFRPIGPYNGKSVSGVNVIQQEDRNQKYLYWTVVEAN